MLKKLTLNLRLSCNLLCNHSWWYSWCLWNRRRWQPGGGQLCKQHWWRNHKRRKHHLVEKWLQFHTFCISNQFISLPAGGGTPNGGGCIRIGAATGKTGTTGGTGSATSFFSCPFESNRGCTSTGRLSGSNMPPSASATKPASSPGCNRSQGTWVAPVEASQKVSKARTPRPWAQAIWNTGFSKPKPKLRKNA